MPGVSPLCSLERGTRMRQAGHLTTHWTRVAGLRIHAKRSVDPTPAGAVPLVLVHGLLVSMRYMLAAAVRLAPRFPVYTLDLPGYGLSDKPAPASTQDLPYFAAVLDGWMRAMCLDRAVLIANS